MDSVSKKHNRPGIYSALQTLPIKLDESYDELLVRISQQDEEDVRLAMRILLWISFAVRPLSVAELQHALAIGSDAPLSPDWRTINLMDLNKENLIDEDILLSVCAGLVTIDQESRIIRLVHYTAEKYLERIRAAQFPCAEVMIARACLAYMLPDDITNGYCTDDDEMQKRLTHYPFLNYAARYWGKHAYNISNQNFEGLELEFLQNQGKVAAVVQVMHLSGRHYPGYSQQFPKTTTALQLSASFGLEFITLELLSRGNTVSAEDENGWTALHRASEHGHQRIVELLLDNGLSIDSSAKHGGTALHRAAKNGHEQLLRFLIDRKATIHIEDQYGGTALHRAAKHGHGRIVCLLLDNGADIDREYNSEVVQKLLNEKGPKARIISPSYGIAWEVLSTAMGILEEANIQTEKFYGGTALHEAANNGHADIIRLLISRQAFVDQTDHLGGTALHRAAANGHERVSQILIEAGADVNASYDPFVVSDILRGVRFLKNKIIRLDSGGRTPLHQAAMHGHILLTRLLLQNGADINLRDEYGKTPLHVAAEAGYFDIVELLVRKGSNVDDLGIPEPRPRSPYATAPSAQKENLTPLLLAAQNGHLEVIRFLLENGARVNHQGKHGTALSLACYKGHFAVVALLLEHGANLILTGDNGRSPMELAAKKGYDGVIELLLNSRQAEKLPKDVYNRSLERATDQGHEGVVRILLRYRT